VIPTVIILALRLDSTLTPTLSQRERVKWRRPFSLWEKVRMRVL
jgi:hypothetical protein